MANKKKADTAPKKRPTWRDHGKSAAKVVGSALQSAYNTNQQTIDSLIIGGSAATITSGIVDDYTNTGLLGGAIVAAIGAGTLKGIQTIAKRYFSGRPGEERREKLKRYGIIAGATAGILTLEGAVFSAYTPCSEENCSLLENAVRLMKNSAEYGYLALLSYGALEATQAVRRKINSFISSGKKTGKHLATAIAVGTTALATAVATDSLNLAAYDSITPFDKEGVQASVAPEKLPPELKVKSDMFGTYVSIHLKSGQSLYSDVILAHTDLLEHDDVMAAADAIQTRSLAIDLSKDHTSYRVHVVGWDVENLHPEDELKIPLEILSDRYRATYQKPKMKNPVPPAGVNGKLKGVHVILDAGHGGSDPGSGANGVVENEVAYDIMVRTKNALEQKYGVSVYPIIKDNNSEFVPLDKLVDGSNEVVLTSPAYLTKKANVGANLRIYKTNDIYRDLVAQGVAPDAIIFMSIHTDAISAHAKGMMIYYPDASLRGSSLTKRGSPYNQFAEVNADPTIEIETDKIGSQDRSYTLARNIIGAASTHAVAVHEQEAIRGRIHRNGAYVPAVIRWNPVPAKVLVEAGNCNNKGDATQLLSSDYRQQIAETLAAGVHTYYTAKNQGSTGGN